MIQFIIAMLCAYLIGSIPTSYILSKLIKGIDIRKYGSGNVGATNALRVLGKRIGVIVLLIDIVKGAFCVLALPQLFSSQHLPITLPTFKACLAALAVFGHIWTIFLGFKGGKGVATTVGVFLALSPAPSLIAILIFTCIIGLTKYVSLSSIIMMASMPFLILAFKQPYQYLILSILLCLLITYTHRENIKRLIAGNESKITKN